VGYESVNLSADSSSELPKGSRRDSPSHLTVLGKYLTSNIVTYLLTYLRVRRSALVFTFAVDAVRCCHLETRLTSQPSVIAGIDSPRP